VQVKSNFFQALVKQREMYIFSDIFVFPWGKLENGAKYHKLSKSSWIETFTTLNEDWCIIAAQNGEYTVI